MGAARARRGLAGLGLALGVGVGVSGCTLPDVGMSPSLSQAAATSSAAEPTAEAATTATATAIATATSTRPSGDLDTGSVTHTVPAGDRTVVVDWWTDQAAVEWTAAGAKMIQLSAHVEGGDADTAITVTRFLATADDGTSRTTVTEDRGEFVLTEPFSYTTALDVPASTAGAAELTLTAQLELLIETDPGSGAYFRQTVLDTITLPLLQEDTP
jgi:hypothetical protein